MKIKIEFEIELPKTEGIQPTTEEIEEWLRYSLNDNGNMACANPLSQFEVEPISGTFEWEEVINYNKQYSYLIIGELQPKRTTAPGRHRRT